MVNIAAENPWVWRVDVLAPPVPEVENLPVSILVGAQQDIVGEPDAVAAGPLTPDLPVNSIATPGSPLPVAVWIAP